MEPRFNGIKIDQKFPLMYKYMRLKDFISFPYRLNKVCTDAIAITPVGMKRWNL